MSDFRPRVWVRKTFEEHSGSILRAVLEWTDQGILLTDLTHNSIACNWRFGDLFGLSPEFIVNTDPESVRLQVYPQLANPDLWRSQLDEVYADANCVLTDVLTLHGRCAKQIKRFTTPVRDLNGKAVARLWTFTKLVDPGFVGSFGKLNIDSGIRDAIVDGKAALLTRREFDLLVSLVSRAGKVVDRETLFRETWGYENAFGSNTLDVYMHRLRKKLGTEKFRVRTMVKSGYLFDPVIS
jgi:PAS domain-containing protein